MKKLKKNSIKNYFFDKVNSFYDEFIVDINTNSTFSVLEVSIIVLIAILFGIIVGYIISFTKNPAVGVTNNSKLNEVVSTYNNIVDNYYKKIDKDKLGDAAIWGMIQSLDDPYSSYMNSSSTDDFQKEVDGFFVGVGVTVVFEEHYNKIVDIVENGPAYKAGLKIDDILLEIDGKSLKDVENEKLSEYFQGKVGTKMNIKIKRDNKEENVILKRDVVEVYNVHGNMIDKDNKIGYIKIDIFSTNIYSQFSKVLKKLEKKDMQSLILDVRGNPGGHLLQTKQILDLFFPKGTILYQIESKNKTVKIKSTTSDMRDYPIVVLINHGSASSSEILASCFLENYSKIDIVGVPSYGKATVQKTDNLKNGGSVIYTTQKWLTPKGKWLSGKGVIPTIEIVLDDEYSNNPVSENDNQLKEAIKILKNT